MISTSLLSFCMAAAILKKQIFPLVCQLMLQSSQLFFCKIATNGQYIQPFNNFSATSLPIAFFRPFISESDQSVTMAISVSPSLKLLLDLEKIFLKARLYALASCVFSRSLPITIHSIVMVLKATALKIYGYSVHSS